MERTRWYEPRIDPDMAAAIAEDARYGRYMPEPRYEIDVEAEPNDFDPAPNLVGSLAVDQAIGTADSLHMPVIDFDAIPMRLVPSSTPGNFHLYIDKPITWAQFVPILEALDNAGLVEHDYVAASIKQGSTFVRPEGAIRHDPRPATAAQIAATAAYMRSSTSDPTEATAILRAELQGQHRLNGESAVVRSGMGHEPRSKKAEQAQAQIDHNDALVNHNLISGVCCGDPGDCGDGNGRRCGI